MKLLQTTLAAAGLALLAAPAAAETAELFGRAAGVSSLSPAGERLAVGCAPQGSPSICVFDISGGGADSEYIPIGSGQRLDSFYWANDRFLLFEVSDFESVKTIDGMQDYNFRRTIAYDLQRGEAAVLMRDEGSIVDTTNVVSLLPGKEEQVIISAPFANQARGEWTIGTYEVNLKTGKSRPKKGYAPSAVAVYFDPASGDAIAEMRMSGRERSERIGSLTAGAPGTGGSDGTVTLVAGRRELLSLDYKDDVIPFSIYGLDPATNRLVAFFEDGTRDGLHHISLEDGSISPITLDGAPAGRLGTFRDPHTRGVVGFVYRDDLFGQVFIDETISGVHAALEKALPGKRVYITSWDRARNKFALEASEPGRPGDYFVFDRTAGTLSPVGSEASHLAGRPLGRVEAISYAASDGLAIPGYLTLPPGKSRADGPFPLVVMPHGGPEARDDAHFDWWAQALAADGYAVLQPNFRGSAGYGFDFTAAGFGEFGGLMVSDVADGAAWAVSEGITSAGGYCAVGASYGGYASLMLGVLDPDAAQCLVAVNAVTDPFRINADLSSDSQANRYWERYMGLDRFDDADLRNRINPAERAGEIRAPVLMLHGEEDTRVPYDQARIFASAMKGRDSFRLVDMAGEDHFLRSTQARFTVLTETLNFLSAHHPAR